MIPVFRRRGSTMATPASSSPARAAKRGTNVDILTEMIAVMNASRAYESDASIFDVGKTLAEKTIELGAAMRVEPLVPDAPAALARPAATAQRFARGARCARRRADRVRAAPKTSSRTARARCRTRSTSAREPTSHSRSATSSAQRVAQAVQSSAQHASVRPLPMHGARAAARRAGTPCRERCGWPRARAAAASLRHRDRGGDPGTSGARAALRGAASSRAAGGGRRTAWRRGTYRSRRPPTTSSSMRTAATISCSALARRRSASASFEHRRGAREHRRADPASRRRRSDARRPCGRHRGRAARNRGHRRCARHRCAREGLPEFADESAHDASASVRLRFVPGAELSRASDRRHSRVRRGERARARAGARDDPRRSRRCAGRRVRRATTMPRICSARCSQRSTRRSATARRSSACAPSTTRAQSSERDVRRAPARRGGDRTHPAQRELRRRRQTLPSSRGGREPRQRNARGRSRRFPPAALKRLSAAVFVDQARALDVMKVRELAGAALGYDARRGDTLAVEAVDFRREPVGRKDAWWLLYGAIVPLAPALVLAIGIVILRALAIPPLASVAHSLVERALVNRTSKAAAGFAPARVRSMLEQEPPHCGGRNHQRAAGRDGDGGARPLSAARTRSDRAAHAAASLAAARRRRTSSCAAHV